MENFPERGRHGGRPRGVEGRGGGLGVASWFSNQIKDVVVFDVFSGNNKYSKGHRPFLYQGPGRLLPVRTMDW